MSKHTPELWKLGPSLREVRDDDDNVLCNVYGDNDEQAEADARLIAAAPDLLAACEAALLLLVRYENRVMKPEVGTGAAIDAASAAVAKARGKP